MKTLACLMLLLTFGALAVPTAAAATNCHNYGAAWICASSTGDRTEVAVFHKNTYGNYAADDVVIGGLGCHVQVYTYGEPVRPSTVNTGYCLALP